ncbi:MAG: ATP-binding protein [Lentisphaeraceae bacterium]|nr:ATP-binding protein [Lentisphaeraceae bacterium]
MLRPELLERLIERLGQMDSQSIQGYFLRLVREKGVLDTIFNTIQEGIVVMSPDLEMEYVNSAANELLGLPENIIGEKINRFLKEIDWNALLMMDFDAWEGFSRQEIEVFYPQQRTLNFYLLPQQDETGDAIEKIVLVLHDITEIRQEAKSVKESELLQAMTMLAAGVAHEIGNPLNSLNIHLQLMERLTNKVSETAIKDEAEELLKICTDEVKRLDMIIHQFLGAVRSSKPEMLPVRVDEILAESLKFMKAEIENKNIDVEAVLQDNISTIPGDMTQLKQAFYNIIKNAIQAMPDGGKLTIHCKNSSDFLIITFMDTGKGIKLKNMGKIFDSFHTDRQGGTGLGLFIVDRVIRDHGGNIGVTSNEGEGTIFTIRLPLQTRRTRRIEAPVVEENREQDD